MLSMLMFQLASCSDSNTQRKTNFEPQIVSFSTDGELFLYTIAQNDGVPDVYISKQDGLLQKPLPETKLNRSFSHIGRKRIYYTEHDDQSKTSIIISCDKNFSDCETVVSMPGAIGNLTELENGNLVFLRCDFHPKTHNNSGYGHFSFYEFDPRIGVAEKLSEEVFARGNPLISIDKKIYFSAYFWGEHRPSDRKEYDVFGEGYTANWVGENFQIHKNKLKKYNSKEFGRVRFDFTINEKLVTYSRGNKTDGYGDFICIGHKLDNTCFYELGIISYPIYSAGEILLAELDISDINKPKIKIHHY